MLACREVDARLAYFKINVLKPYLTPYLLSNSIERCYSIPPQFHTEERSSSPSCPRQAPLHICIFLSYSVRFKLQTSVKGYSCNWQ